MNRAVLVALVVAMALLTACDLLARFDSPPPLPVVQPISEIS